MVSSTISQEYPLDPSDESLQLWLQGLDAGWDEPKMHAVAHAGHLALEAYRRKFPENYADFVGDLFAVARILVDLEADHEAVSSGFLHQAVKHAGLSMATLQKQFESGLLSLVKGVSRMDAIQVHSQTTERKRQNAVSQENLRKMLLAMVDDVRVVLIKLAERLHLMRKLNRLEDQMQVAIARETLDVFSPLANRLGIWQMKWELEDLSLRYLEPAVYKQIAAKLADKRVHREQYIANFIDLLQGKLEEASVESVISGRPKHIFSIWKKMKRKDLEFEHIFDVQAVRVLVDEVADCYTALGVVHTLWPHIPGEFDDYIATPKNNNYQSIHTAIIGPEGKVVEVQLRTHEMHSNSELGVAAHWRYKENSVRDESLEHKIAWLRQLLEWKDELNDSEDLLDQFKSAVLERRVYVFSPKGKVIDLPEGATPLDFAYTVHTDVGHRCRGAKVNGQIVPLTYQLKTGEQVEVLTVKSGGPSRDWSNTQLGYIKTPRARLCVQRWFKQQNYDSHVSLGRAALEKELQRLGVGDVSFEKLAQDLNYKKVDDFFAAIGSGDLKTSRAVARLKDRLHLKPLPAVPGRRSKPPVKDRAVKGFAIEGVGNLLTTMASCCNPLPGDPIIGYITQGRGVTVHRRDCANALRLMETRRERLVEVDWGIEGESNYPVELIINAYDRQNLLHDITAVLADMNISVLGVNLQTDKMENTAKIGLSIEVSDIQGLSQVLSRIDQIPNVTEVRRRMH